MFCLYFTFICPCDGSNGFFYGSHSIDSDEVAHASLLILICTDHILLTSVPPCVEFNGYFHGTHSIDSDEMAQMSLLI